MVFIEAKHRYRGKTINRRHTLKYSKFKSNVIYIRLFLRRRAINERNVCTSSTDNETDIFGWCKKVRLFKQKLRPILRWLCWFNSSRSMGLMSQVQWRSNDDFLRPISDQQSLRIAWNHGRGGTKKVPGTRYSTQWKTPQIEPNRTVPYHAVEKRH